jgi:2-polyprenyl-6-methoxyphenol hydroxylase-like FAD-dependent oxidoreductase
MSPADGVGINLALQDAVATANLLALKLRTGQVSVHDLGQVEKRREWPTRLIQSAQVVVHRRVVTGRSPGRGDASLIRHPAFQLVPDPAPTADPSHRPRPAAGTHQITGSELDQGR